MASVLAFTITRGGTPQRVERLQQTLDAGRTKAGMDFAWRTFDNSIVNKGQHYWFNAALKEASIGGYDYLLRVDDDIDFLSQRWLAKMVEEAVALGPQFIVSPTVKGLKAPPEMSQVVTVSGVPVKFLSQAIGGACRLHPVKLLTDAPVPYVSDVRQPLGFGDASGILKWAKLMMTKGYPVWCVWLEHVRVQHSTAKQEEDDPQYHAPHGVLQHIPWMPAWPEEYR